MTHAPGDPSRQFVLTQSGAVRIVRDGVLEPEPFLDLTALTNSSSERGLLGLAFHPDYRQNGRLFVFHSKQSEMKDWLVEYTVAGDPATSSVVAPDSRRELLSFTVGSVHHGGWIGFGPDAYLYVSTGDVGSAASGQNRNLLNGKILRLDVNRRDPGLQYAVPLSNPLPAMGLTGRAEIWAYGLRNPWRCSFDRLTGAFWIGDVGEIASEEINRQDVASPGGENYGWACVEGLVLSPPTTFGCNPWPAPLTPPVHVIPRYGQSNSIIGGYVYRGSLVPRLAGMYVFADGHPGNIFALDAAADPPLGGSIPSELLIDHFGYITSFGEDAAGELYVATLTGVYRIVAEPCSSADLTCGSNPGAPGYGQPNGILDPDDFRYFILQFQAGNHVVADLTAGAIAGVTGFGVPDGRINNDDFFYYLLSYAKGC